jgi:hypothetical protein
MPTTEKKGQLIGPILPEDWLAMLSVKSSIRTLNEEPSTLTANAIEKQKRIIRNLMKPYLDEAA